MGRTGVSGSHAGSDNSTGGDPNKKTEKEAVKEASAPLPAAPVAQVCTENDGRVGNKLIVVLRRI